MTLLLNSVRVAIATTGQGTVTVGAAVAKYLTPANAGALNNGKYSWRLDDGDDFEIFEGTYSSSGPTVSRDTVIVSSISGVVGTTKLTLSGTAQLSGVARVQDLVNEDLQRMVSVLAMQVADLSNLPIYTDNRFADSFDVLTYVDTAGATNLDTTTAGLLKPFVVATVTNAPVLSGSPVAWGAFTYIDRGFAITNGAVIQSIDIYSLNAGTFTVKVVQEDSTTQYDILVSQNLVHGGTGWESATINYTVPGSGTHRMGCYMNSITTPTSDLAASAVRSTYGSNPAVQNNLAGATATTASLPAMRVIYQTTNCTVASNTITAGATVAAMRGVIEVNETVAATAGTDYSLEFSANNGTNWTVATLTEKSSLVTADGTLRVVEAADTPLANTGTQMKWRFKTLTNKMIHLNAIDLRAAA